MKIFILFFLLINLYADSDYSLRLAYGTVTSSDFGEILVGDIKSHPKDLSVVSLDAGYLLKQNALELPLDIYLKAGFSNFNEDSYQDDVYETMLYIKLYYNLDFLDNRVRVGFGEGVSYTDKILTTEYDESQATTPVDNNSKILNYIDFSLDFDLGKLVRYKPLEEAYIGFAIKHRSGIFGLINNVEKGGSNYNTLYIQKNF